MLNRKEKCGVFLDIDNTLTSGRYQVPEENIKAIAAVREKGHMVFINTGRSWANIPQKLRSQLSVDGIIAGSGAYVNIGGKEIFRRHIPRETVLRAAEYAFEHNDIWMVMEGMKGCYAITNNIKKVDSHQLVIRSMSELEAHLENDEIQVIAVTSDISEDFRKSLFDELTFFPMGYYYDCVVKGLSKASGIREAINAVGIKPENTIAMGDGGNDIDMIKFAGIGVAMANAQPHIIEAADYITDSNTEYGVAKAMEKFLL